MNITIFGIAFIVLSTITSLLTEAVKKCLDNLNIKYISEIIVLIIDFIVSVCGSVIFYIFNNGNFGRTIFSNKCKIYILKCLAICACTYCSCRNFIAVVNFEWIRRQSDFSCWRRTYVFSFNSIYASININFINVVILCFNCIFWRKLIIETSPPCRCK